MNVYEIRPLAAQQIAEIPAGVASPDGPLRQAQSLEPGVRLDLKVTAVISNDGMSFCLQQLPLLVEDEVLTPRLLIRVVDNGDFHSFSVSTVAGFPWDKTCNKSPLDTYVTPSRLHT